jgi:SAM-dependent methyltransferase
MTASRGADEKAHAFFEDLWRAGDYWELESSPFEDARHAAVLAMLAGRHYGTALEIGCGGGAFTRRLAGLADHVLALDIAPSAIERARVSVAWPDRVEFRVANVMEFALRDAGPFDLVVMSETIYYLGWLYPFFDVAWMAAELFEAGGPGGRLLLANTCGGCDDALLRPWIIRTYRDLFLNVGYRREAEKVFRGVKNGAELEVLISLFRRPQAPGSVP